MMFFRGGTDELMIWVFQSMT